jgi:hypothetical protein
LVDADHQLARVVQGGVGLVQGRGGGLQRGFRIAQQGLNLTVDPGQNLAGILDGLVQRVQGFAVDHLEP